jgi:tetratricopeptide (TPR) repeat protein
MKTQRIAAPLLLAGFLAGWLAIDTAQAQRGGRGGGGARGGGGGFGGGGGGMNRGGGGGFGGGGMNRPTPTMSRPNPGIQRPASLPAGGRPGGNSSIGQRPNLPNQGAINARPTTPRPISPGGGGNLSGATQRPNFNMPGMGGAGTQRPSTLPAGGNRPNFPGGGGAGTQLPNFGGNTNNRPNLRPDNAAGFLPGASQLPAERPSFGERPNLPVNRPGGGGAGTQFPNRPDIGNRGGVIDNRPGIGNRGGVIDNRPNIGNRGDFINNGVINNRPGVDRPGLRPDGGHNTVINNRPVNVTNIQNRQNWANSGVVGAGGYRPWVGNAVNGYHAAWHNNFNNWSTGYHPWYHGYWGGGWGYPGAAWAWSGWALAGLARNWGYAAYANPFYAEPVQPITYVDYSQPIVMPEAPQPVVVEGQPPPEPQPPPPPPETATQAFDAARDAFFQGDYKAALVKIEQSLKDFPNDPVAHEFRALTLFAMGEYRSAAAAVHAILAGGPGWDWTTVSFLYSDSNIYKTQLAALEKAAKAAPDDSAIHFLLAYHYTTLERPEDAKKELEIVHKLLPNDGLTTQLLRALSPDDVVVAEKPKEEPKPAAEVNLDITGSWLATRKDGGTIGLTIQPDGKFTWAADVNKKKETFGGSFAVEDDVLLLERSSGGALTGHVVPLANDKFNFRIIGSPDADPGLTFVKK